MEVAPHALYWLWTPKEREYLSISPPALKGEGQERAAGFGVGAVIPKQQQLRPR
jgi:hypothetical protein